MGFPLPKLAPYVLALLLIIGAFFYGRSTGKDSERVVYQTKVIQAGERHANIEQRQSEIIANRSDVNIVSVLLKGDF